MTATVTTTATETVANTPYHRDFAARAKEIGGRWNANRGVWTFDRRDDARVRALVKSLFGIDGSEPEGDLVTVRVKVRRHEVNLRLGGYAEFAGLRIAERRYRDSAVKLAAGVILVEGQFDGSGGSTRYPEIDAADNVVVEIRDLPRAALDVEDADSYEIVSETVPADGEANAETDERARLTAEREALLARLAEIDALLGNVD